MYLSEGITKKNEKKNISQQKTFYFHKDFLHFRMFYISRANQLNN